MRRRLLALAAAWLGTRAVMLGLLASSHLPLLGGGAAAREVWRLYRHWYGALAHGAFPSQDPLWQYPPGAGAVLLAPGALPWLTYFQAFVALTLVADAAVAAALARAGLRPGRSLRGAALWTGGLPLLLHVPLVRLDVQVTALAVASLLTLTRSPRESGGWAALGTLVKGWPALVLLGTPRGRATRTAWHWAAGTGVVALALLATFFTHPLSFLRQQGDRGVQIESLGGTVLSLASHAGWRGSVGYRYGALEYTGPYVAAVAGVSLGLTAAALALLALWRVRAAVWTPATPYDAALSAVLLFTVTSRVLSPQYLVWLLGLAAVCLSSRHTVQRPAAALIVAATAVTAVVYPLLYDEVRAHTWTGTALLLVRNGLLAAAAAVAFVRLWRAGRPRPEEPDGTAAERVPRRAAKTP
ncbi:glycosyltransferase 87 family protein [Streptomyces sp. NPDC085946]|uniref:glycosyltransferase 87 family protein n=1 Tax=Streptomyces sp. NPDC085946 TaxID=3365744 RepID=UPI0037D1F376